MFVYRACHFSPPLVRVCDRYLIHPADALQRLLPSLLVSSNSPDRCRGKWFGGELVSSKLLQRRNASAYRINGRDNAGPAKPLDEGKVIVCKAKLIKMPIDGAIFAPATASNQRQ